MGADQAMPQSSDTAKGPYTVDSSTRQHWNGSESRQYEWRPANVILITGLQEADEQIQIQALELLRTRRIYTHTAIHPAPRQFLMIVLCSVTDSALVGHLNDHIFLSHYHNPEEGYTNLERSSDWPKGDHESISSVVHRSIESIPSSMHSSHRFVIDDIGKLASLAKEVTVTAEATAYLHNLVVFLRLNRAVRTGVSPTATAHFELLSRILSSIHGFPFATPAIIGLAFRKIYRHRVKITTADFERSMQYGSDLSTISAMLKGVTADEVLEDVLAAVEVPV